MEAPALASTFGVAALCAAIEVAGLAAAGRPALVALPWIALGDGLLALAIGVALRGRPGLAAGGLALLLLASLVRGGVAQLFAEGQLPGAVLLALVPLALAGAAAGVARRRELPALAGAALVAAIGFAAIPSAAPPASDRTPVVLSTHRQRSLSLPPAHQRHSVVLITVDGLGEWPAATFPTTISPTEGDRAGQLAVLTGLHPLRTGVLREEDPVSRAYTTLFEVLHAAGYATAAFTSTADHRAGWSQGFDTFDDPHVGAYEAAVSSLIGRGAARSDAETLARAEAWWRDHAGARAAWVQLSDPASVHRLPAFDGAAVAVVGTHGPGGGGPLSERSVRVPLRLELPAVGAVPENQTPVRTLDVAVTLLDAVGLADGFVTEGVTLAPYLDGRAARPLSCTLVGERDGRTWLGLRTDGVKVLTDGATTRAYLLGEDPTEANDVSASIPDVVRQAERALAADRAALARWGRR